MNVYEYFLKLKAPEIELEILFQFLFLIETCNLQDFSSPTRDQTQALGSGSIEFLIAGHQGIPYKYLNSGNVGIEFAFA